MGLTQARRVLAEAVRELSEGGFTDGLGAFGGNHYTWPEAGGREWDGPHPPYPGNTVDRFGDSLKVEYMKSPVSIDFDATQWYGSEGKQPVTFVISAFGKKKSGKIKAPTKANIERVMAGAQGFANQAKKLLMRNMPKFSGWKRENDDYDVWYDKHMGGKYSEAGVSVTFSQVADVLADGDEGRAEVRYVAGGDYQGQFGVKEKTYSWRSLADMKRIMQDAEQFAKKAHGSGKVRTA